MVEAEIQNSKFNEIFYLLVKQEEVSTSLYVLLSHLVDNLAVNIDKENHTALSG